MHNLLFWAHKLYMNYVINTFLLVSSSLRSKQLLCFVHGQGQKREQKPTTKKFAAFHNHSPLLTMVIISVWFPQEVHNDKHKATEPAHQCIRKSNTHRRLTQTHLVIISVWFPQEVATEPAHQCISKTYTHRRTW